MDWQIPLVASAVGFALFLLWKVRPELTFGSDKTEARIPRDLRARIETATDDVARAEALADAADLCAGQLGRANGSVGYYLRAMRANPASAAIVDRAARALARRPRTLEVLLWRRLGSEPWTGASRPSALAAARHLARLYYGPLRNRARGRAFEHLLATLGEGEPPRPSIPPR